MDEIERVLIVTAHPDDLDFGAAGTISTFIDAGKTVGYCICTDGDAGGFDPDVPRSEIPSIRRREQTDAGAVLGVKSDNIYFLGYPDGALTVTLELRRDISRVIRQFRPELVLCQSPERDYVHIYASHPDHMAAGEAAMCAVYPDARNPFAHSSLLAEGHTEWTVPEVWIMSHNDPNHFVDITDYFSKKIDALMAHISQTEHTGRTAMEKHIRTWNSDVAKQANFSDGRLAESFRIIDTK